MPKKNIIKGIVFVLLILLLVSCNDPVALPTTLPETTSTFSPTKATPSALLSTATITPLPHYPNKQVIFDYYDVGFHSVYDSFFRLDSLRTYSRIILYDDGQMVITGDTYRQKILSSAEVDQFISNLEVLGFFLLESNKKT